MNSGAVAEQLGAELIGSADVVLRGLEGLEKAQPNDLSFVRDTKHIEALHTTKAGAVIISREVIDALGQANGSLPPLLVVEDADRAMLALLDAVAPPLSRPDSGVHPTAVVDDTATIGQGVAIAASVSVGPGCSIGDGVILGAGVRLGANVVIGDNSELRSNVVIEDRCTIGRHVMIHAGAVIGSDGFGYIPSPDGLGLMKVPHAGHVEIGDDVEIGANTTIDRGKFGATSIGDGTKIDNLVQIGHNCVIGRACVICGCCGISGSVTIGDGVMLGGGVGVSDGIEIGAKAVVGGFSGVKNNIPAGETWIGYPARPGRHAMRIFSATEALPEIVRTMRKAKRNGDRA